MILFRKALDLAEHLQKQRAMELEIGFIPTMGALHKGHLSLIEASKKRGGVTVCSIFINPTQFNDPTDFQKYPSTIEKDIYLLEKAATDILFLPSVKEIYPGGTLSLEQYDLGYLESVLEGKYRPGHFQGVCQVMHRLLDMVKPDLLFMGQKDYQQCMVIKRLMQLTGSTATFIACETEREKDGLAMSSRNTRLNENERKNAAAIYQALNWLKENINSTSIADAILHARAILERSDFKIDYVEVADAGNLEIIKEPKKGIQMTALIAAFQHEVRLIDNMLLNDRGK